LVRLIAPILVFTSEEVWKYLPSGASAKPSVHMASFPSFEPFEKAFDDARSKEWDRLLTVREEVLKALEPLRAAKTISAGLEARITLAAQSELAGILRKHAASLPAFFIVSQVEIGADNADIGKPTAAADDGLRIQVERAHGKKCPRCWNYSTHVGESEDYPDFCERCVAALEEIERDGGSVAGSASS
jgi:isoleucyl-tRNA synthetase